MKPKGAYVNKLIEKNILFFRSTDKKMIQLWKQNVEKK